MDVPIEGFGPREVWIIEATATGPIGDSHLTSYFDEELGFVKLKYVNVDNSQFIFSLSSVTRVTLEEKE